ncbi:MAG: helix-turn-helix domain-containing protein [Nitrospirae bacterium]|nr:helix-turn-helix domain-containing protein [Nitrospirota bacterium]
MQAKSYFTRTEVARLFEVSPNTISRWVRQGKLPSIQTPGGRRRYPQEPILRLMRQLREGVAFSSPGQMGWEEL